MNFVAAGDSITRPSVGPPVLFWDVMSPTFTNNDDTNVPESVAVH